MHPKYDFQGVFESKCLKKELFEILEFNLSSGALSYKRNEINKTKFFLQIWWTSNPIRHLYLWKLFPPERNSGYHLSVHFRFASGLLPALPKLANWKNWFCIWTCICSIHSWFNLDILAIFVDRPPNYSPLCTLQIIIYHIDSFPGRLFCPYGIAVEVKKYSKKGLHLYICCRCHLSTIERLIREDHRLYRTISFTDINYRL